MESQLTVALTFIGGGVLATSIIDGLRDYEKIAKSDDIRYEISITTRREEHADDLRQRYPDLLITTDNRNPRLWKAPSSLDCRNGHCDGEETSPSKSIVLICTQPQFTSKVCEDIRSAIKLWPRTSCPVVVTMCPGITTQQLQTWLKQHLPIVRTMPNTPVSERQGATAMFANSLVSEHDIEQVMNLFRPISPAVCRLPQEELLDVAASVSGSSPAYFFTLMEMLVDAAVRRGMPRETASVLVKQSAFGSAVLAQAAEVSLDTLRKDVCMPGGSTKKAIDYLYQEKLDEIVESAVHCSLVANRAMGVEAGQEPTKSIG